MSKVVQSFSINKTYLKRLREKSAKEDRSVSWLVNEAIKKYLAPKRLVHRNK